MERRQVARSHSTGLDFCPWCWVAPAIVKEKLGLYVFNRLFTESECSHHCSDKWGKNEMISE